MAKETESKDTSTGVPAPEVLKVQSDDPSVPSEPSVVSSTPRPSRALRRGTYRPSHKATFVGMGVVAVILAANAVVITMVLNKGQLTSTSSSSQGAVTLDATTLNKLGVSRNTIGTADQQLTVGPNSQFNGKVTVGGDLSVGGQMLLNGKFVSTNAEVANLQAGNTALNQLSVNGDATASNLNLRSGLTVLGATRMQGAVTMSQLLTVDNNLTVVGNLAVGGVLSARGFEASSLVSDTTLTIGGHIITAGNSPGVGPGSGLGANATVSISGNDAAGTIAVNVGVAGASGTLAQVAFHSAYAHTPHVVVSADSPGASGVYATRTANGFTLGVGNNLAPGGYVFDYIVMQ